MSPEELRSLYFRQLQGRVSGIVTELTRVRYSARQRSAWVPAINAYRCRESLVICVELAGIDRSQVVVNVEPRRVWVRGQRVPPSLCSSDGPAEQVLAVEIDYGPFEREIILSETVDPDKVHAEHREGLLWIRLPLAEPT